MTDSPKSFPCFYPHLIGSTACEWLSSAPGQGKVLAVVTNCIYLVNSDGQLVWLSTEKAPLHTRSIQLAGALPGLAPDDPFRIEDQVLVFPNGVAVNPKNAEDWRPADFSNENLLALPEIYQKSREVFSHLARLQPPGFGSLINPILASFEDYGISSQPQFDDPVLQFAWPAVRAIGRAAAAHDVRGIYARGNDLVGLGNGLTPSGDDFLGGLFFGLHILNQRFPSQSQWNKTEISRFLMQIGSRTNLISATLLGDLAGGLGPAPLHAFIQNLLMPESRESSFKHALALASIGHSTGWDILTGLLSGLLWTRPEAKREIHGRPPQRVLDETVSW
jgi:Protein of unknown function (DUF2877)